MKRLLCILLAVLALCGCAAAPAETTSAPVETTLPAETTLPVETTVPAQTTAPTETTSPAQTEPALAPIHADYAEESFNAYHAYWGEESDYITAIGFTASETITNVQFGLLDWFETESYQMDEVLFTIETMTPEQPFLAHVTFWGDMTTYGLSFTDESGTERHFYILISGMDGSLICEEYTK